ncbi:MAG TPA: hypothetical protein GX002_09170 [Clostridiales bacterium]|jgi:hypothetical protein|nr:hypothetical protein [Clostridiales bacterium]
MKILWNEFIKIFCKKSILLLSIGLIILNGVLQYVNERNAIYKGRYYPAEAYKHIYADMEKYPVEELLGRLQEQYRKLQFFTTLSINEQNVIDMLVRQTETDGNEVDISRWMDEYNNGDYLVYTDNLYKEMNLYSHVISEVENCINYPKYLAGIQDTAIKYQEVSIFSDPGSFSYKNIIKTAEDFNSLQERELDPGPSHGVKMFGEFLGTDLLAVLFIAVVVISLITREKEQSQFILLRSTYKGRSSLIISKLLTAYIGCILAVISFYGMNYILALNTYGFGDMNRPIQSVFGYIGSNLSITLKQYILLFLLFKVMVYILIASVIFFLAVYTKDTIQLYVMMVLIALISGILYGAIPHSSYLSFLKYINLIGFLHTWQIIGHYLNINIFTLPVNYLLLSCFIIVLSGMFFSFFSIFCYCRQYSIRTGKSDLWDKVKHLLTRKSLHFRPTVNLFLHECHKIFITGKALILLIIFFIMIFTAYNPIKENFNDINGAYYKQYMLKLEGIVNEEKLAFIRDEDNRFVELLDEYTSKQSQGMSDFYLMMEYQELLAPHQAFNKVKVHAEYLKGLKKGQFLYDTGYKLLTGHENAGKQDILLSLIAVVMLIACLTYVYSIEYQSGVYILLRSGYKGRGRTFAYKLIISAFVTTVVFIGTYLPVFYNVLHAYGVRAIHASANSMEHLSKVPDCITILGYLAIISLMRYTGLLLAVLVVFYVSVRARSFISSLLASTGVLVLPLLIALIGVPGFKYVLLNPLLIGNIFS